MYHTQQTERYARLFDLYMTRNAELMEKAPTLYAKIESLIRESHPAIIRMREIYRPSYKTKTSTIDLAHRYEIKLTIERGEKVPENVLAEYPDLQKIEAKKEPTNEPTTTDRTNNRTANHSGR